MKRSQILKILDEMINDKCEYGTVFWDDDINKILTKLEEVGMKPPVNSSYVCEWEPEDD